MKWPIIHDLPRGCGKIAFYTTVDWRDGSGIIMAAEQVIFPDGSQPEAGEKMVCGSCGALVSPRVLKFGEPFDE